jgi:hypothetical protein
MLFLFIVIFLSCSSVWAAGTIISDNFDDGIIDTSIWRLPNEDEGGESPERYPIERNGHLEIYNDGIQEDSAGVFTRTLLPADSYFEVQVSFNASECDEESALFLSVHNAATDYDHTVQYALIGNEVMDGRKWLVIKSEGKGDENPVIIASEPTSTSTGVLYITYDAGIINLSYAGYGVENTMYTVDISGWTDCTNVFIGLLAWSNGAFLSGSGSYFDDFCLETGPVGKPGGSYKYLLEQYYPLAEGITWNYLQNYQDGRKDYEIFCVGGTEKINGETTNRQWEFDSGELAYASDIFYTCFAWTKEGLRRYKWACSDGSYTSYNPPLIQLPYRIQVGETFSHSTIATKYDTSGNPIDSWTRSMEITLEGQEDVEVYAGIFTGCLKLSIVEVDEGGPDESTLWLAPGIGEIKSATDDEIRELISYTGRGTTFYPGM